jgi:hypothetical protein
VFHTSPCLPSAYQPSNREGSVAEGHESASTGRAPLLDKSPEGQEDEESTKVCLKYRKEEDRLNHINPSLDPI